MFKIYQTFSICFFASLFCLSLSASVRADADGSRLVLEGRKLTAQLKAAPLATIREKMTAEAGIWLSGNESLFERKITVAFEDLPLEDGLKRILGSMDHCFIYDRNQRLVGVDIIGLKDSGPGTGKRSGVGPSPTTSAGGVNRDNGPGPGEKAQRVSFHDGKAPGGTADLPQGIEEEMKIVESTVPPGGTVKITEKDRVNMMVAIDLPPPGGPVRLTLEDHENMKIVRDVLPLGN